MSSKSNSFYFDNFAKGISISCDAAVMLKEILMNFSVDTYKKDLDRLHEIEHRGDKNKHELMGELVAAFVTPIERNDIIDLSENIDNVTDLIEDILIHMYMNDVKDVTSEALAFVDILIRCCNSTRELMDEFRNFKKSSKLKELIISINDIEEEGDQLYVKAMRDLHQAGIEPLYVIAWREVYDFFERSCDACEDVADIVERITIGNI